MIKRRLAALFVLVIICVSVPIMSLVGGKESAESEEELNCLTLWQVDGFEGGKGSRASYLSKLAQNCFDGQSTYVAVTSLTADAVRENLAAGNIPDMISYNGGFYGLESFINAQDFVYKTWCRGGYCIIAVDEDADFSDVNSQNTVINSGKDNLSDVAALFCGLEDVLMLPPTGAYVQVLSGKYKYLLGTQRDVFRFRARKKEIKIKVVSGFNDLYQNISVLTKDKSKYLLCQKFVNYLIKNNGGVDELGLFCDGKNLYGDNLHSFENVSFEYKIQGIVSSQYLTELKNATKKKDINLVKNLLK
jgi:hypothetical protein